MKTKKRKKSHFREPPKKAKKRRRSKKEDLRDVLERRRRRTASPPSSRQTAVRPTATATATATATGDGDSSRSAFSPVDRDFRVANRRPSPPPPPSPPSPPRRRRRRSSSSGGRREGEKARTKRRKTEERERRRYRKREKFDRHPDRREREKQSSSSSEDVGKVKEKEGREEALDAVSSCSESVSLSSLSPSPEREATGSPLPTTASTSGRISPRRSRSRSPPPRVRPGSASGWSPPPPPWMDRRDRGWHSRYHPRWEPRRRSEEDYRGEESWEAKVLAFVQKTQPSARRNSTSSQPESWLAHKNVVSVPPVVDTSVPPPDFHSKGCKVGNTQTSTSEELKKPSSPHQEKPVISQAQDDDLLPPGVEASQEEDLKATPLVRYIGKRLSSKKGSATQLRLEGVFRYNLLSLLTRAEWVAAKTLKLLEKAGYSENALCFTATTKGGPALETELKSAVFTGKIPLDSKPELVAQVLRVVECLVRYFTTKEEDPSSQDEVEEEETSKAADEKGQAPSGNVMRRGVAGLLKELTTDHVKKEGDAPVPNQEPRNPWTFMWDHLQSESLHSFSDMKNFIAKDLLRLGDSKLCSSSTQAFDVAQDMVSCLVLAGYSHRSLQVMVRQAPAEDILPPKDQIMIGLDGAEKKGAKKKFLYDVVMERLEKMRGQMPDMTTSQLEYLVRKCLTYVMRGCDKVPLAAKNAAGANIIYNYLPPGLREMESQGLNSSEAEDSYVLEEGQTPQSAPGPSAEDRESTDPLNSILNPAAPNVPAKPNELPPRKYLVGSVHAEWLTLLGKQHLYEISVYFSDMTSQTVYMVPEAMQRQPPEVLDALGFVANPDRPEFYFVQVGVGVIKTLSLEKAVQKLVKCFEEKRHSSSESRNNGIVLNFYGEEEVAVFLEAFERTGHKNIFLDTVKGLGFMDSFMDRNKSKKLEYSGAKVRVGGSDSFYHTEVRRGLQAAELVSKTKSEALHQALEFFLEGPATYKSYLREYCFPALSPRADEIRWRHRSCAEMYHLEVFLAAQMKMQKAAVFLEGIFCPAGPASGRELRDKYSVLASRICRVLVNAGFSMASLRQAHEKDPEFAINSNVFLDRMNGVSQRLKLMDQTMRSIRAIKSYFQPSGRKPAHDDD